MRTIRILAVGRLKTAHWREASAHYQKRLPKSLRLDECIAKDAEAGLPLPERRQIEAERLLKLSRPGDVLICLDENGRNLDSPSFADFLRRLFDAARTPCFVIGGAYGLAPSLLQRAEHCLSFGSMTFPHELARVLLMEQLYRAENIMAGTGYHH